MAQVYYHKLYLSDIRENMPTGLSEEDSLDLVNDFINDWIKEQLLLHEAEKKLSVKEKNFDRQMEEYRNNLLINAYYNKILSDTSLVKITDEEMEDYVKHFGNQYTVNKEIVRLNYVKLAKGSKLIAPVKEILFNEARRSEEKGTLDKLLSDSVEYMTDDNTWLYLDDIRNEVNFDIDTKQDIASNHIQLEKEVGEYHYLIVLLDYKNKRSVSETEEEQAAARMMLINQKRQQIIEEHVNKLYEKAIKDGIILQ